MVHTTDTRLWALLGGGMDIGETISGACVVATAHVLSHPFTDASRARFDVSVVSVSVSDRDHVAAHIPECIITRLG